MKLIFICIQHDPNLWRILEKVGEHCCHVRETPAGPVALLMTTSVQEDAGGFLRLELARAAENRPQLVDALAIPPHLVSWMVETIPEQQAGFLGVWGWPFPVNRPPAPHLDEDGWR